MKVEFTERGDRAFDEVLIFLMEQQEVPMHVAEDVEESIEEAARELSSFPDQGRPEEDLSEQHAMIYRSILARERYRIIYYVDRQEEKVHITDVFDTRRDPSTMQG